MDATITATLCAFAMVFGLAALVKKFSVLKRSYYYGITLWSNWLPVISVGIFFAVLASNIAQSSKSLLSLGNVFGFTEMVMMFLLGPLFLTRVGNILATSALVFCYQRMLLQNAPVGDELPLFLFIASLTFIAILGDKMPWLPSSSIAPQATRLREMLLVLVSIAALAVLVATIVKIHAFGHWLSSTLGVDIPKLATVGVILAMFGAWLSVILGVTRHISLPILSLPTAIALAFVTGWSGPLLVVPFAICIGLSLAIADRRHLNRRHSTIRPGYTAYS